MRSTVFLTTAGQHVTGASSDTVELTDITLAALQVCGRFARASTEIAQGPPAQPLS